MPLPADKRFPYSTKHFVWLHTPKTGGTWLYQILSRLSPAAWGADIRPAAHVRVSEVEDSLRRAGHPERIELPWLAAVRNPWDWYVSLYFFMEQHYINGTGGFAVPAAHQSPGCRQWASRFTRGNDVEGFRRALPELMVAIHEEKSQAVCPQQSEFLRCGTQLRVRPIFFERLRESFIETVEETGAKMPPLMKQRILNSAKSNASGHAEYAHCYDAESGRLVARHESWIVDTFGYSF